LPAHPQTDRARCRSLKLPTLSWRRNTASTASALHFGHNDFVQRGSPNEGDRCSKFLSSFFVLMVSRPGLEPGTTALKVRLRAIPQLLPAKNQALSDIAFAVACGRFVFFGARHGARQAEAWRLYRHAPFSSLGKRAPPFTTPEGRRVQFPSEAFLRHTLLCFEALSNLEAQGRYGAPVMRKTCALILLVKSPRKL
jgi:hypothetical protein